MSERKGWRFVWFLSVGWEYSFPQRALAGRECACFGISWENVVKVPSAFQVQADKQTSVWVRSGGHSGLVAEP